MHSHAYSGNPLLGTQLHLQFKKYLREEDVINKAQIRAKYLNNKLKEKLPEYKNI